MRIVDFRVKISANLFYTNLKKIKKKKKKYFIWSLALSCGAGRAQSDTKGLALVCKKNLKKFNFFLKKTQI